MITTLPLPHFQIKRLLTRSLVISVLSMAGVVVGLVPAIEYSAEHSTGGFTGELTGGLTITFGSSAYAQTITDEEIANYAQSVLEIEPLRQSAYEQIKQITGSANVPPIACHRPNSLNELPSNIRQIAINYCNQAIEIVEQHDLTISRFNAITVAHQDDPALSDRIQQAILQLQ